MKINVDRELIISTGDSAKSLDWETEVVTWGFLSNRLMSPEVIKLKRHEYKALPQEEQDSIKDVGGYVGGFLDGHRRRKSSIKSRSIVTLDIDFGNNNIWDNFTLHFDNAAIMHPTFNSTPRNLRFRLIIPLERNVTPEEYMAVSRMIASRIGMEFFDPTTFQPERMMFWPACPSDVEFDVYFNDKDFLDPDRVLAMYDDWTDATKWPTNANEKAIISSSIKQEDPLKKDGIVGAFCNTYTISEAIDTFLGDVYEKATKDRYTYKKGTTFGGVIVYDNKFAYSHHSTDPASEKLCNAFDLVRLHKFGDADIGNEEKAITDKPSYKAMVTFCTSNRYVVQTIADIKARDAMRDFSDIMVSHEDKNDPEEAIKRGNVRNWKSLLKVGKKKGDFESSSYNINLIFRHDENIKGLFCYNEFDNRKYLGKSAPWRSIKERAPLSEVDLAGIRSYLETAYGIVSVGKIDDALELECHRNKFHPVKEYLTGLEWDGVPRVDRIMIDYFRCVDNAYSREVIRKMLVGAVARIFNPGCKFDYVLVLVGPSQGEGKSTFIRKMGQKWFSDTFNFRDVTTTKAFEQLQGAWLIEMAEMTGFRKAEVEGVKSFISKQYDNYRQAYGRVVERYDRQCVFFATTNEMHFLRDYTGNRRFLPILVRKSVGKYSVFSKEFDDIIDQLWAEAVQMYKNGEEYYRLSEEAEKLAMTERESHMEKDERIGVIESFLNMDLPAGWEDMSLMSRRMWLDQYDSNPEALDISGAPEYTREYVCVAEIWCELFRNDKMNMSRYNTQEINKILRAMPGWVETNSTKNFKLYGKQRYYMREVEEDDLI